MLQSERVRAARAERLPDVTVSGGLRHLAEVNATGFLAGVSLPLPLFNRHGALVQAAQSELDAARAREEGTRLRLQGELADARDRLLAARDRWDAVRLRMQPAAREALEQLRHGYQAGRFTYLDQLEGQRAALDADLLELETIRDTWSARLELERLLGRTLEAR
jgi:cobalt-zinc-cadmium efflux system outer membrane protein